MNILHGAKRTYDLDNHDDVDTIVAEIDKAAAEGRLIPAPPEKLALLRAAAWKGYKGECESVATVPHRTRRTPATA